MFGLVIATVAGAVIGGAVQGATAYKNAMDNAKAYKKAADDIKKATEKYSGKEGYNKMVQEGMDYASDIGTAAGNEALAFQYSPENPGSTGAGTASQAAQNAGNVADTASMSALSGFNQGMANQQARNEALYNKETTQAQQALKQANIDYNVANQTAQLGMDAVSGILNAGNSIIPKGNSNRVVNGKRGKPVVTNTGNPYME